MSEGKSLQHRSRQDETRPRAVTLSADKEKHMQRRTFLLTSLLSALLPSTAEATEIDPKQTFVLQRDEGKSSGANNGRRGIAAAGGLR
jgi:hypothetical protein